MMDFQGIPPKTPRTADIRAARVVSSAIATAALGRNLGTGSRLVVQGSVMDAAGRPADALIRLEGQGHVTSTAGRFSMFDLRPGRYMFSARSIRGGMSSGILSVPTSGMARITVRVP